MKIQEIWSRILQHKTQPECSEWKTGDEGSHRFQTWIRTYRQRLDTGCELPAIAEQRRTLVSARTPVIALVVSPQDREVLTGVSEQEPLDVHFATSRVEAWDEMNRLKSPLILYDRDWPDAEWRTTVQTFASSPLRSCVLLATRAADDNLWQELIRRGGYDLVAKPFRTDDVARSIKMALSFWTTARAVAQHSRI